MLLQMLLLMSFFFSCDQMHAMPKSPKGPQSIAEVSSDHRPICLTKVAVKGGWERPGALVRGRAQFACLDVFAESLSS